MTQVEAWTLRIDAVKALGDVLVPIVLALGGALAYKYKTGIDAKAEIDREGIARRGQRLEELGGLANDIYCFTILIGHYRSISPTQALEKKRQFESHLFATLAMWDDRSIETAMEFIDACYITKQGPGTSAKLTSDAERQIEERAGGWDDAWSALFLTTDDRAAWISSRFGAVSFRNDVVKPRYARLLASMSRAMGGNVSEETILKMLSAA